MGVPAFPVYCRKKDVWKKMVMSEIMIVVSNDDKRSDAFVMSPI